MLCLILSLIHINIKSEKVSAAKKKYLVLVQNYDGDTWTAYDKLLMKKEWWM